MLAELPGLPYYAGDIRIGLSAVSYFVDQSELLTVDAGSR